MQLILNLELYAGRTDTAIDPNDAVAKVQRAFPWFDRIEHAIVPNAQGRDTLVTRFDFPLALHADLPAILHLLCETTDQEAIAYKLGEVGALAGPAAESWGAFDPSQFIQ